MKKTHIQTTLSLWTMLVIVAVLVSVVRGQAFTDPGFESYAVSPGGFVQPASGAWSFSNDAGVVEPFANSSTGTLHTWSAIFAPVQGLQYASTYAGGDSLRQSVSFSAAGDYRLSVLAAAPSGSLTILGVGAFTLGDGEFGFTLAGVAIGGLHTVTAGSDWSPYSADFTIEKPCSYQLGVKNTLAAPYFINYDAFAIQPVPEPSTLALILLGGLGLGLRCKRRRGQL